MKYFLVFSLILFSICGNSLSSKELIREKCDAPFGACIGQSFLTKAYSNGDDDHNEEEMNFVFLTNTKITSGLKWQCVEYARRWLIDNKNLTFADVNNAYQIWDLWYGNRVDSYEQVPVLHFKNKITTIRPQIGDLLIYSTDFAVTGHVAVIVGVNNNSVKIAEQNYFNDTWDGADFSRRLLLQQDEEGRYRIFDDAIIGWMHFALSKT